MVKTKLELGAAAPDLTLLGADGAPVTLSERWGQGPTLLSFLRHFG